LTIVAAFADPGPRDEFGAAAAALLGHRLLERENARFLGQEMGIMEIAMIHVRNLFELGAPATLAVAAPEVGEVAQ